MNPFIESDGYYILMDLLGIPNLRKKAFGYTVSFARSILKNEASEVVPMHDKCIFLGYSICAPIFLILFLFLPSLFLVFSLISSAPSLIGWGMLILFLGIFFEVQLKAAMKWYRKTCLAPIDLKKQNCE